jgi:hypothetical protein
VNFGQMVFVRVTVVSLTPLVTLSVAPPWIQILEVLSTIVTFG